MRDDPRIDALIDAARGEPGEARAALLEPYRNYLRLLARTLLDRQVRGKADASDVVQETFLKATERFDQFRGRTEPELAAWLRQILSRNVADLARRYTRDQRDVARERSIENESDRSSRALASLLADSETSPSGAARRRELGVVFADALAELEPDHREVIVLRNIEDLEWDEVGRKMRRTEGAVRMLWARALLRLKPLVEARL